MPLPPAHGPNGEVLALDDEELYRHWAKTLLMNHAGGWSPDSIPGRNATAEFEAFERQYEGPTPMSAQAWVQEVRAGLTDLSGNRLA